MDSDNDRPLLSRSDVLTGTVGGILFTAGKFLLFMIFDWPVYLALGAPFAVFSLVFFVLILYRSHKAASSDPQDKHPEP
jgi:uncharacterized membrane protein (UPF0136 family)